MEGGYLKQFKQPVDILDQRQDEARAGSGGREVFVLFRRLVCGARHRGQDAQYCAIDGFVTSGQGLYTARHDTPISWVWNEDLAVVVGGGGGVCVYKRCEFFPPRPQGITKRGGGVPKWEAESRFWLSVYLSVYIAAYRCRCKGRGRLVVIIICLFVCLYRIYIYIRSVGGWLALSRNQRICCLFTILLYLTGYYSLRKMFS